MNNPTFTPLPYTYKKSDSDVWVLNLDDVPVDKKMIKDQQIIHLAPEAVGGNHKHPRTEWFVAMGDLVLVWLDENGARQEKQMNPDGQLMLTEVSAFLPHAVVNRSKSQFGILYELADGKMRDVEAVKVTDPNISI